MIVDILTAGGFAVLFGIVGIALDQTRSSIRSKQVKERVEFQQRRIDLVLRGEDPDAIGTLDSFRPTDKPEDVKRSPVTSH